MIKENRTAGESLKHYCFRTHYLEAGMSSNPVIYWELASHDASKTADFFKKVFDRDFEYNARITIHLHS